MNLISNMERLILEMRMLSTSEDSRTEAEDTSKSTAETKMEVEDQEGSDKSNDDNGFTTFRNPRRFNSREELAKAKAKALAIIRANMVQIM